MVKDSYTLKMKEGSLKISFVTLKDCIKIVGTVFDRDTVFEKVEIPSSINGINVGVIAGETFAYLKTKLFILPRTKCKLCKKALSRLIAEKVIWPRVINAIPERCFEFAVINKIEFENVNAIKSIGQYAFFHTVQLEHVEWPAKIKIIPAYCFADSQITSISGHDDVEIIMEGAFEGTNIIEFDFKKVKMLDKGAFKSCEKLKKVTLPIDCTSIGAECFSMCKGLEEITNTEQLKAIGTMAFFSTNIKEFVWPSAVTCIPSKCFYYTELNKITGINSVTSILDGAFCYSKLSEIELPSGLKKVGSDAFSSTNLSKITFPADCTSLAPCVLFNCSELEEVRIEAPSFVEIFTDSFLGTPKEVVLSIPNAETVLLISPIQKNARYNYVVKSLATKNGILVEILDLSAAGMGSKYIKSIKFLLQTSFDAEVVFED